MSTWDIIRLVVVVFNSVVFIGVMIWAWIDANRPEREYKKYMEEQERIKQEKFGKYLTETNDKNEEKDNG